MRTIIFLVILSVSTVAIAAPTIDHTHPGQSLVSDPTLNTLLASYLQHPPQEDDCTEHAQAFIASDDDPELAQRFLVCVD